MTEQSKELMVNSFKDYLRTYFDANIIEFRIAIKCVDDENDEISFMIHPLRVDGTTLDLVLNSGDEIYFESENDEEDEETTVPEDTAIERLSLEANDEEF